MFVIVIFVAFTFSQYVALFCKYLGVPFYVRTIDEIQRTQDHYRDFYESITKKIRFDSYKFLGNPVILGHNWNDCVENIITNINCAKHKTIETTLLS